MSISAGTRLGHYDVVSALGAGGMGEVYRARDRKLKREVAVKVLPESLAKDPDALARFEREALAVAALSHPNILSIFDFGSDDGVAYAVMELLEGGTLRDKLEAGPIPQRQAVDFALQIARGLAAAHDKGIVHRDLKPENLFVSKDGHVKILDFGLARHVEKPSAADVTSAPTESQHTAAGTILGTIGYISPEQVRGYVVDHRSDIFSFGSVFYELLSGTMAFKKGSPADTMAAILMEEPPELSESAASIPIALGRIVKHCLEKDPSKRFQSARDLAFALSEASERPGMNDALLVAFASLLRRHRRSAGLAVVAVLLGAAAVPFLRSGPAARPPTAPKTTAGPSIAVLPFQNLSSDRDQEYFSDGLSEELIGLLTKGQRTAGRRSLLLIRVQGHHDRCAYDPGEARRRGRPGRERPPFR